LNISFFIQKLKKNKSFLNINESDLDNLISQLNYYTISKEEINFLIMLIPQLYFYFLSNIKSEKITKFSGLIFIFVA